MSDHLQLLKQLRFQSTRELIASGVDPIKAVSQAQRQIEAGFVSALLHHHLLQAFNPLADTPTSIPPEISIDFFQLSRFYQDYLETIQGERRTQGSYFTPQKLVDAILIPLFSAEDRLILDPACGMGAFLSAVFFRLIDAGVSPQEALTRVYGSDIDSRVVELCRIRLALDALSTLQQPTEADWNEFLAIVAHQIQVKEALLEAQWGHGFDLIVGNPPFVSAREMVKSGQLEFRQQLAKRYRSARGAFDLAGVFVERSLELLNPGGKLGMVVPHKLFAAEYGAPIKTLLDQSCREHTLLDFSHEQFFHHARVYPKIILAVKAEDSKADRFHLKQTSSSPDNQILAKINAHSSPLSRWCQIQCGTAGFSASRLAKGLVDGQPEAYPSWPFRVSGNIDPYQILQKPLRYQHRRYQDPYLIDSAEYVTSIQRRLFSSSKIVVAGMVRCLEAAFDLDGIALGVNTYACTGWKVDPFFLLGVLNSKVASYYYREQFSNKHLAGDYITINKGTLGRLPVPEMDSKTIQQIRQMVTGDLDQSTLDDLFFDFYGLSSAEIDTLLSSLPPL